MTEPNPILNAILNAISTKLLIFLSFILDRIEDRVNVYKVDGRNAYIDLQKSIYAAGGRLDFYNVNSDGTKYRPKTTRVAFGNQEGNSGKDEQSKT